MITTIRLANTCIMSHNYPYFFLVRICKIYFLSNFQVYNTVLLITTTMLCIRSSLILDPLYKTYFVFSGRLYYLFPEVIKCDGVHQCESIFVLGAGFFSALFHKATQSLMSGKFLKQLFEIFIPFNFLFFFLSELFLLFFSISVFLRHILYLPNFLLSFFFFHFCCHILNAKSSFVL